ncbi:NAD-dependent epimerase/dehydratase family protein [Aspergillus brunneoviolaceus CBS 621.78]|uniref:NAD(P)-binding protein n=1 Tax=Aspergillus brunneoviolaceus CBS 621.78 TaxID=1450534 RepID=A0ACD1GL57_9EURO|nr:NAD(P)-binding protein [Aspergillus brunneoviolaceus CBS 621.78]RAH50019.1 NAD(P)-binding protein [Aspergillus brunneoviolaceus CBS 621.78]
MALRIFITGATGLIGGDFLHILVEKHPDWEIVVLVRNVRKISLLRTNYPTVEIIPGSLDDVDLLEQESSKSDVVLNFANCDHLPAAEAIIRGLARRKEQGTVTHTSGAKIIAWEMESQPSNWGQLIPRYYNDLEGVAELTSLPSAADPEPTGYDHVLPNWAAHRDVDMAILRGREHPQIRTAIVCPPTVYGPSRFPGFTRSIQVPRLLNVMLRRRRAFTIHGNENRWHMVHTQDIARMYLLLTEAAVDEHSPRELWNEHGYYFAENGEFAWGDVTRRLAELGYQRGWLDSPEAEDLPNHVVQRFWYGGQMNVSSTSLGVARRAREMLGWTPMEADIFSDLERMLDVEATLLWLRSEAGSPI